VGGPRYKTTTRAKTCSTKGLRERLKQTWIHLKVDTNTAVFCDVIPTEFLKLPTGLMQLSHRLSGKQPFTITTDHANLTLTRIYHLPAKIKTTRNNSEQ